MQSSIMTALCDHDVCEFRSIVGKRRDGAAGDKIQQYVDALIQEIRCGGGGEMHRENVLVPRVSPRHTNLC